MSNYSLWNKSYGILAFTIISDIYCIPRTLLLIPYSDNPNAPNQIAAKNGLSNIFKLLAPTIKNINAPYALMD